MSIGACINSLENSTPASQISILYQNESTFYTRYLKKGQSTEAENCSTEQVSSLLRGTSGGGGRSSATAGARESGGDRGGSNQDGLEDGLSSDGGGDDLTGGGVGRDSVRGGLGAGHNGAGREDSVVAGGQDATEARCNIWGCAGVGLGCECDESLESVSSRRGVDRTDHSFLTVSASGLTTVEPDGLGVVDGDGEGCGGRRHGGWDKAREETASERMAGISKAGLSDSVVLWIC